jgi:predicted CopG family antitoxin
MKTSLANRLKSFVANSAYVEFESDTGNLLSVRSSKPDGEHSFIEVEYDQIKSLKEGTESFSQYIVEYNGKTKALELKYKNELDFNDFSVDEFIYKVPTTGIDDPDITIIQDIDNTCWKILIGKQFKKSLKEKGIALNSTLYFSVTAKNDPNILYKLLSCNFAESVKQNYFVIPFTEDFEYELNDVSIYTIRMFDTYLYTRMKNGKET